MSIAELIKELEKYPKDLKVWVSDGGYCEGATPLKSIEKVVAWEANLDGDAVDDEYEYILENQTTQYMDSHKIIHVGSEIIASKYILMINGEY